jgi:predicted metalloprotease with PDZ domain
MVLDKLIRQATGNGASLFSKTGALCSRYNHSAFSRSQLKALLEENTSLDLSGFFATFIDSPGALDTAELSSAWHFVDSCGAFEARP